jgi:outer membrane protein assembly factor BamB
MYRGNAARTGVNPGPSVEDSPKLLWQFDPQIQPPNCGPVFSSPVVVDKVVYVGGGHAAGVGSLDGCVLAVDGATGKQRWYFHTRALVSFSPAVVDGTAYVASGDGNVFALDAASGEERWRFQIDSVVASSPAVVDDILYAGGSSLFALATATGAERWRFPTPGDTQSAGFASSPAVVDGAVYVGSNDRYLYALAAATGKERWRFLTGDPVDSTPAVADGVVYAGSMDGYLYAVDADTGTQLWRFRTRGCAFSAAVAGDVIYVSDNDHYVYALTAATGEEIWRFEAPGYVTSAPTVADDMVYVGSDDDNVYALDAGTGQERWRFDTGGEVHSTPAVVGGVVYVVSGGKLNAITEGAEAESATTRAPASPATGKSPRAERGSLPTADDDPALGPENAPVTIIEFGDFECPYSARFARGTLQQILEEYGDKVRFVFRDYPLPMHANAEKAAQAAECAHEQGAFWRYHDVLFENPGALDVGSLKGYAASLGLDAGYFNQCLDSGKYADEVQADVADGRKAAAEMGDEGLATPSFFVGGDYVAGAHDYAVFKQAIDFALRDAGW